MESRNLVLIGVMALAILAVVAAAGCTDTGDSRPQIVGVWGGVSPTGVHGYFVFNEDGTGARYIESGSEYAIDPYIWELTDVGCDVVFEGGSVNVRVPFVLDRGTLVDSSGVTLTKQDRVPELQ